MDPLALDLLMARFDNLETLIRDGHTALHEHISDDEGHKVVHEHKTYWGIVTWCLSGLGALVLAIIAWIGAHLK